jgi:hypothetical protein
MPNAPFHFPIHGGWPLLPDWFGELILSPFVSSQAMLWAQSPVDLQVPAFVAPMLRTVADRAADEHCQRTPPLPASLQRASSSSQPPSSALKAPAPEPASIQLPEARLQQQIADMEENFRKQMTAMKDQFAQTSNMPYSPPQHERSNQPAPQLEIIDITGVESPMKDLSFDAFRQVKQYSPAKLLLDHHRPEISTALNKRFFFRNLSNRLDGKTSSLGRSNHLRIERDVLMNSNPSAVYWFMLVLPILVLESCTSFGLEHRVLRSGKNFFSRYSPTPAPNQRP